MLNLIASVLAKGGISLNLADLASSYSDTSAATTTYQVQVVFRTDGTVDVLRLVQADLNDEQVDYALPVSSAVSVRCLYVSGSHMTGGDAEDTWHALGSQRAFVMTYTSGGGNDEISGTFKFQLSLDGGTTVHEDSGNISIIVGEIL